MAILPVSGSLSIPPGRSKPPQGERKGAPKGICLSIEIKGGVIFSKCLVISCHYRDNFLSFFTFLPDSA